VAYTCRDCAGPRATLSQPRKNNPVVHLAAVGREIGSYLHAGAVPRLFGDTSKGWRLWMTTLESGCSPGNAGPAVSMRTGDFRWPARLEADDAGTDCATVLTAGCDNVIPAEARPT